MTGLEALDPARVWRKRSIDNHLSRLRERGLVRRVKRSSGTEPAVYVRVGVEVDPLPFEDMTLVDVIASVLETRPMNPTEMVVAMLEAGYKTSMEKIAFRDAISVELKRDKNRFRRDNGRWLLVQT